MTQKGSVWLIVLIVILLIVAGLIAAWYFVFYSPQKQLEKGRTPDSTLKTEESMVNRTEVRESGLNSELVIYPSNNDIISGVVTIKANKVPPETKHVGFSISQSFEGLGANGPNLGFASNPGGWQKTLNTTEYDNGVYYIGLFAFETDASSNPIGTANALVEIKN